LSPEAQRPDTVVSGLQRAVALMEMAELSRQLRVPPGQIREWINKYATMPRGKVAALAELLKR
jgi:hypothetical protein